MKRKKDFLSGFLLLYVKQLNTEWDFQNVLRNPFKYAITWKYLNMPHNCNKIVRYKSNESYCEMQNSVKVK